MMSVINFAHGEFVMLGMNVSFWALGSSYVSLPEDILGPSLNVGGIQCTQTRRGLRGFGHYDRYCCDRQAGTLRRMHQLKMSS
jgi:hypothetical protein